MTKNVNKLQLKSSEQQETIGNRRKANASTEVQNNVELGHQSAPSE